MILPPSPFERCLVFLIDGARPDVLSEERARGNLPNLSRHFYESGTWETMTSVFPSTTGPAYLPFLTGCYPGTCNVPGIRWFDKDHYASKGWSFKSFRSYVGLETFLMNWDMAPGIQSAFEIFSNPFSFFNMVHRGIPKRNNRTRYSRIWYSYYAHLTDHWSFIDQAATRKLLSVLDRGLDFAFVVYPAIDEFAHRSHPHHERTRQAYRDFDGYFGEVIGALRQRGWLDSTLLMVVADHGLSKTDHHFDVGPYLEERGVKCFFYTQIFKRNFKAASMVSGNGMVNLYFSGDRGWKGRVPLEELSLNSLLIDELRLNPAVDLMMVTGADGKIHLINDRGQGWYTVKDGGFDYSWQHGDPLGLSSADRGQNFLTRDQSHVLTFDSPFPDVFEQSRQIFISPRAGDIILSAKSGYDFRLRYEVPLHRGSHGSLCPEHMKIPFLCNVPINRRTALRSVDVFPTILQLMGKEIPPTIDGRSLI